MGTSVPVTPATIRLTYGQHQAIIRRGNPAVTGEGKGVEVQGEITRGTSAPSPMAHDSS